MAPFADALATHSGHDAMLINWRYPSLLIRGRSALLRTPLIFPLQPTYKSGSRQNQIKGLVAPYSKYSSSFSGSPGRAACVKLFLLTGNSQYWVPSHQ